MKSTTFIFELFDLQGNLLNRWELIGKIISEQIEMSVYTPSIYILKITSKDFTKSFNIIKY